MPSEITYAQVQPVPIRPILGYWAYDPGRDAPLGSSPDVVNCTVERGLLRKRMGYAKFPSDHAGFGEPVTGLFVTQDVDKVQYLYAATPSKMYYYDSATMQWIEITGAGLNATDVNIYAFENSQNKVVFSNGVDKVQVMDYTGPSYAGLNANAPACKFLCRYNGRLNLGHTFEGAGPDPLPYRHRRPVRDDHTDWTGLGSGFRDQDEFPYHMQNMRKMLTVMMLYYEHMIEACIQQPDASAPFRYETRVADIGLYGEYTLDGRNDMHFFLGGDDFYQFNGATPTEIGAVVRDDVFRSLNTSEIRKCFGKIIPATKDYACWVPGGGSEYADTVWVYNWARRIWHKWTTDFHRVATIYRLDDAVTIDDLTGTIDEQNFEFDSIAVQSEYPSLITGHQDGYVHKWNPTLKSDDGAAIPCRWTSSDFTAEMVFKNPERQLTLERITVEYQGIASEFTLSFYVSTDGGLTWDGPFDCTGEAKNGGFHTMAITPRTTGDKIRFKFEQNSATESFAISRITPEFTLSDSRTFAKDGVAA